MYTENETANGQNQRDGDVPMGKEQRQSQKPSSGVMVLSRVTWVWWKSTVAFGTARISLLDKDSLGQLWFFSRGQAHPLSVSDSVLEYIPNSEANPCLARVHPNGACIYS